MLVEKLNVLGQRRLLLERDDIDVLDDLLELLRRANDADPVPLDVKIDDVRVLGEAAGSRGLVRELLRRTRQIGEETHDDELATAGERAFDEVLAGDLGRDPAVHRQPAREQLAPDVVRGAKRAPADLYAECWEAPFVGNDHVPGPNGDEFGKGGGRRVVRRRGRFGGLLRGS